MFVYFYLFGYYKSLQLFFKHPHSFQQAQNPPPILHSLQKKPVTNPSSPMAFKHSPQSKSCATPGSNRRQPWLSTPEHPKALIQRSRNITQNPAPESALPASFQQVLRKELG